MESVGAKVRELKVPGVPGSRTVVEKARPLPPGLARVLKAGSLGFMCLPC